MNLVDQSPDTLAMAALTGLAMGDSFGERYFFPSAGVEKRIADRELAPAPWRYTDDTAQAAVLTRHLIARGSVEQDSLAQEFAEEYAHDPKRGYGINAHDLLAGISAGRPWRRLSEGSFNGTGSMGNGAAMRVAPLGAYFAGLPKRAAEQAARSAEVTHANANGIAGAEAVAVAASMISGGVKEAALIWQSVLQHTRDSMTRDYCELASRIPPESTPQQVADIVGNGSQVCAHDTVPFALWSALANLEDFEEAMWFTVAALGDRDTTCAIVGGLVCSHGSTKVPPNWKLRWEGLP